MSMSKAWQDRLRRQYPDVERWEDRGGGLYRGDREQLLVYVLILPDRRVPKVRPILVASITSTEPPALADDSELVRGGVASMAVSFDLDEPEIEHHIRTELTRGIECQNLPECVVPVCGEKALVGFLVAETGRFAGRDWTDGDKIRLCPTHAVDVRLAQGVRGVDQLAEWLRPDVKLDTLDLFDAATDLLFGQQIAHSRARILHLVREEESR
jgi:hypothetical protein